MHDGQHQMRWETTLKQCCLHDAVPKRCEEPVQMQLADFLLFSRQRLASSLPIWGNLTGTKGDEKGQNRLWRHESDQQLINPTDDSTRHATLWTSYTSCSWRNDRIGIKMSSGLDITSQLGSVQLVNITSWLSSARSRIKQKVQLELWVDCPHHLEQRLDQQPGTHELLVPYFRFPSLDI